MSPDPERSARSASHCFCAISVTSLSSDADRSGAPTSLGGRTTPRAGLGCSKRFVRMATPLTPYLAGCLDPCPTGVHHGRDDAVLAGHQQVHQRVEPSLVVVFVRCFDSNPAFPRCCEGDVSVVESVVVLVCCVGRHNWTLMLVAGGFRVHG